MKKKQLHQEISSHQREILSLLGNYTRLNKRQQASWEVIEQKALTLDNGEYWAWLKELAQTPNAKANGISNFFILTEDEHAYSMWKNGGKPPPEDVFPASAPETPSVRNHPPKKANKQPKIPSPPSLNNLADYTFLYTSDAPLKFALAAQTEFHNPEVAQRMGDDMQTMVSNYLNRHPIFPPSRTLANYCWGREAMVASTLQTTNNVANAIKTYLSNLDCRMARPGLHIYGVSGSGKSHLVKGLVRYIVQNIWTIDDQFMPVEHVYWPTFIDALFNNMPQEVDWKAPLLVIEDLDARRPIPKSGSTYWLEHFMNNIKPRLEDDQLPTIFVTHRPCDELEKYLATNIYGDVANAQAKDMAADVSLLIAGNCCATGKTHGGDLRRSLRDDSSYYDKILQPAIERQSLPPFLLSPSTSVVW